MTPETLDFAGNAVTYLGFVGVVSAFIIVVSAFRSYWKSSYNIRVTPKVTQNTTTETIES